jgi:hypothetical protein
MADNSGLDALLVEYERLVRHLRDGFDGNRDAD